MYKTISNICIILACSLLIVTLALPEAANTVTDRVLGSMVQKEPTQLLGTLKSDYIGRVDIGSLSTNNIIDATNRERIKAGLPPLKMNPLLDASATSKVSDMVSRQYFEHISPTGEGVADLGRKAGYTYIILGENLALGNFIDGDDVVKAWMNSPGHRANILNPKYEEIGVYATKALYQGKEVWFAVQHFGTDRMACPSISASLKNSVDSINKSLKQRQAQIAEEKALLEGPNHPVGDEYKARVTTFNGLVAEYNTALVISQEKIKQFNAQVAAFNSCLAQYQAK